MEKWRPLALICSESGARERTFVTSARVIPRLTWLIFLVCLALVAFTLWPRTQFIYESRPVSNAHAMINDNCAVCHTIRGFKEAGKVAPDLTHVASRLSLGAGRLPNSRGNRAGWVVDAPGLKPHVYMPSFPLPPDDLQALLDYLDTLR